MVSRIGGAPFASGTNAFLNKTTPSLSDASFTQQLAAALEQSLNSSGNGSRLEIDIQPAQGQNSGAGQFLVTVKTLGSPSPSEDPSPVLTTRGTPGSLPTSTPAPDAEPSITAAPTNEVDAYWASQPAAVQALRNIPDEGGRMAMAQDLAGQGYAIDVPIMVWGWDPLTTMMTRQECGYTWVPSGNQPNIGASYDPNSPPPGSIKVTTDFAKGLEQTDPWFSSFAS